MMLRITITVAIEEGILCWLLLMKPETIFIKNPVFIGVGMILVTIVSLGIQLWWVTREYGITM